ncbi:MAG: GTP cyclohydrolase I FolE [Rhodospirillales bacterium]|nr:GTP cyclohydrolase I FolE [Alphaproteobacteria bacterium]MCB1841013.1 GTP cyclohydrolase I FolE [Alphaproteobacteria bacterium]MCB9977858.1 GTP cyclohydrolase I FolE [Rhodospirillales bacterium]
MTVEHIGRKRKMAQEKKPTKDEAMRAVETLIRWAGDDPAREGLRETPKRVVEAYEEFFCGYAKDPAAELGKTFEDIQGFDDIVIVRDINFTSHCEHHMVPIIGQAHVAYWPTDKVVGISKLARIVDIYAKRLISQENMTRNIVDVIDKTLKPKGAAVMIRANHQCMSIRGVNKAHSTTVTTMFSGIFKHDESVQRRFLELIKE